MSGKIKKWHLRLPRTQGDINKLLASCPNPKNTNHLVHHKQQEKTVCVRACVSVRDRTEGPFLQTKWLGSKREEKKQKLLIIASTPHLRDILQKKERKWKVTTLGRHKTQRASNKSEPGTKDGRINAGSPGGPGTVSKTWWKPAGQLWSPSTLQWLAHRPISPEWKHSKGACAESLLIEQRAREEAGNVTLDVETRHWQQQCWRRFKKRKK